MIALLIFIGVAVYYIQAGGKWWTPVLMLIAQVVVFNIHAEIILSQYTFFVPQSAIDAIVIWDWVYSIVIIVSLLIMATEKAKENK